MQTYGQYAELQGGRPPSPLVVNTESGSAQSRRGLDLDDTYMFCSQGLGIDLAFKGAGDDRGQLLQEIKET